MKDIWQERRDVPHLAPGTTALFLTHKKNDKTVVIGWQSSKKHLERGFVTCI